MSGRKKTPKPQKYVFEVGLAVREIWVFEVVARTRAEAKKKVCGPDAVQICSVAGGRGFVRRLRRAAEDEE